MRRVIAAVAVVLAIAVAVGLRFLTQSDLWLDEALTVNIARLPVGSLEAALRQDGAPPLYYLLLHYWMLLFGTGDLAVRSLSGVLGCIALPLAYLVGVRLGGDDPDRRGAVGWAAVLVIGASPFAIRYSTETRMYMLAVVLVLLGHLAYLRALERPTLGRLTAVTVVVAGMLYTVYWSLYLVAVVGVVFLWRAWRASAAERPAARRVLVATGVGGILFLPWVPTFLYQAEHTGTPWGTANLSPVAALSTVSQFAGGNFLDARLLAVLLAVLALVGLFAAWLEPRFGRVDGQVTRAVRWEALIGAATLGLGLVASGLADTTYQTRYAAVVLPFFALSVACGLGAISDRRLRYALLSVIVVLGLVGGVRNVVTDRTQAGEVAAAVNAGARTRDVVVYCPDQVAPDVNRLIPRSRSLRQYTFPGFGSPTRVDWVDYAARNHAADPVAFARRVVERGAGAAVYVVWEPGYRTYGEKCEQLVAELERQRGPGTTLVVSDSAIFEHMRLTRFASAEH